MKREAISFGRFSSPKQELGSSLERQKAAYEAVCERRAALVQPSTRYGFGTFFGKGESGFHGVHLKKGGSLRAFLNKIEGGEIDPTKTALVIEGFDRPGRLEPDLATRLLSDIIRSGCALAVYLPDVWIGNPDDLNGNNWFMVQSMIYLAHQESKQKAERGRAAWKKRRQAKGKITNNLPRWIAWEGGRFVLIREKAAVIRRIFSLYCDGLGARLIARTLNEEGVPTLRGKGVWDQEAVRFLLKSRTTIGEYQPKETAGGKRTKAGEVRQNYYPAVVSEEVFYQAQGVISQRGGMRGRKEHNGINLFKGILFDARSKSTMNIKVDTFGGNRYRYLVPSRSCKDGSAWVSFSYDQIEAGFLAFVQELKVSPAKDDLSAEMAAREAVIAECKARLEKLNGEEDLEDLLPVVRSLQKRRKEAEAALERLKERQAASPDALDELNAFTQGYEEAAAAGKLMEWGERLRNKIRGVVSEMWVLILPTNQRTKTALVQVFLRQGGFHWFVVEAAGKKVQLSSDPRPWVDPRRDLRLWKE
jgi:DNA invertase Pin-like site-specific DNA recombinase